MRKSARTQIPPFFDNDPYIYEFLDAQKNRMIIIIDKL